MKQLPKVESRINHIVFGFGTVKKIRQSPLGNVLSIDFDVHGTKEFNWTFAGPNIEIL